LRGMGLDSLGGLSQANPTTSVSAAAEEVGYTC
jgi:hypothetical protein